MISSRHSGLLVLLTTLSAMVTALPAQEVPRPVIAVPAPPVKPDSIALLAPGTTATTAADSARHPLPDSLVHYLLPSLPGSIDPRLSPFDVIDDTTMEWTSARTLNQVVSSRAGIFGSDPSGVGQYFPLIMRGAGLRSHTVLVDGRPAADPASGIYNLSLFPMEMADRIEVITGPRSFVYGTGAAGGTVNIVTRMETHRIPFTKIRYEEAGYEHAYSDGSFNQNLTRRANLALGYQYIGTGSRYYNSAHDQWNIRGALRYHLSPRLCLVLSEHYVQTHTGLNGGIDYRSTGYAFSFEPKLADVYSFYAYEKLTRHDVDLRLIGFLLPDSTDLSTLSVYYSQNLREFRDEEPDGSAYLHEDHFSSWFGARLQQALTLGANRLTAGISAEVRRVNSSPALGSRQNPAFAAWAFDEMQPAPGFSIGLFGRAEIYRGEKLTGIGIDASLHLGGGFGFRGGTSVARRAPCYAELFWTGSAVLRDEVISSEQHQLVEGGLVWSNADLGSVQIMVAHRTIVDPIVTAPYAVSSPFPGVRISNSERITTFTAELSGNLRFFRYVLIEGTGTFMLRQDKAVGELADYPKFWGGAGLYFSGTLLEGTLGLKAGVRGQITTRHNGYLFSPPALFPLPNTIASLGMGSTLDLLAVAHIGSAYVHVMWENVTDAKFYSSPFTPVMDRTVRFGISWEFLN